MILQGFLLIAGSRSLATDSPLVTRIIREYMKATGINNKTHLILHGAAKGVDLIAEQYAKDNGFRYCGFPARWDELGKRAGYVRNQEMVDIATCALVIWDGVSPGTTHTIAILEDGNVPHQVVNLSEGWK